MMEYGWFTIEAESDDVLKVLVYGPDENGQFYMKTSLYFSHTTRMPGLYTNCPVFPAPAPPVTTET